MKTAEKRRMGFAAMTPEKQREIASRGGKAAHASGHAHQWTVETAAAAGRKGGSATKRRRVVREVTVNHGTQE